MLILYQDSKSEKVHSRALARQQLFCLELTRKGECFKNESKVGERLLMFLNINLIKRVAILRLLFTTRPDVLSHGTRWSTCTSLTLTLSGTHEYSCQNCLIKLFGGVFHDQSQ